MVVGDSLNYRVQVLTWLGAHGRPGDGVVPFDNLLGGVTAWSDTDNRVALGGWWRLPRVVWPLAQWDRERGSLTVFMALFQLDISCAVVLHGLQFIIQKYNAKFITPSTQVFAHLPSVGLSPTWRSYPLLLVVPVMKPRA